MQTCITNGIIHSSEGVLHHQNILVENGTIKTLTGKEIPENCLVHDLKGLHISAGFIDIQINGGEKFYFSETPTGEALEDICTASLQYGVTHLLPCLISSTQETILQAIDTTRSFMQQNKAVVGLHIEGPFINPIKRGAHLQAVIRKPTNAALEEIIRHGKGVVKVMTIAPECFTDEQLDMLLQSDIVVSAGHSAMTYQEATRCFKKGIRLVTHLYNAMTQFGHREPGLVGAVFKNSDVYAPVILDGAHCDYAAAQVAYKIKKDKLFLISDAAFLSRKVEHFEWGEFNMHLTADGHYRNTDGNLAGASISMVEAIQNAKSQLGVSTEEAVQMATSRASKAIRFEDNIGFIKPGYPASFAVFDDAVANIQPLLFK